eukprot:Colp12_sorted_trinity150504_noHs@13194
MLKAAPASKIPVSQSQLRHRKVERARKAQLYLLRQAGPNAFVVRSDQPTYSKVRVILGPQTCSCGQSSCVHLLFVMVRVLKVEPSSDLLWTTSLKNYEVDTLLRNWYERKIFDRSTRQTLALSAEDDCPICLLPMCEGERLTWCKHGCCKALHDNCMAVWADERKARNELVCCPLCRSLWRGVIVRKTGARENHVSKPLQPTLVMAEPLPTGIAENMKSTMQLLGQDVVCCIFSKNWRVREQGLLHLHSLVGSPFTGDVSGMLDACCTVLVHTCDDKISQVYRTALAVFKHLVTPQIGHKELPMRVKPVVDAIITRCSEGTKRLRDQTLSTILDLCKGSSLGLSFLVRCAFNRTHQKAGWRWLLGRLVFFKRLIAEYPTAFATPTHEDGCEAHCGYLDLESIDLMRVFSLALSALPHPHPRVNSTAAWLVYDLYEVASITPPVSEQMRSLVHTLPTTLRLPLEKNFTRMDSHQQLRTHTSTDPHTHTKPDLHPHASEDKGPKVLLRTPHERLVMKHAPAHTETEVVPRSVRSDEPERDDVMVSVVEELTTVLGRGAFSVVKLGRHRHTGSKVAIKQIVLGPSADEKIVAKVVTEAEVMSRISHENIVRCFGCVCKSDTLCIFIEYMSGGTIASLISEKGVLPDAEVRNYTQQVLRGLEYLHNEARIIHRDIKGANLLLTESRDRVKLSDFGLAASLKGQATLSGEFRSTCGTVNWMSPEMMRGEDYGREHDVWSVGATVYEMAVGRPPWDHLPNMFAVILHVATSQAVPTPPNHLPNDCRHFMESCFNRDPGARPKVGELLAHPFIMGAAETESS